MVIVASTNVCRAQSQEKIYSLMLLSFAKGIHWPGASSDAFVVGVIEYPPLIQEMEKTTLNSNIHGRRISVLPISDLSDIAKCHIVFLPAYKSKMLTKVLEHIPNNPILIVSNKMDLARHGGCIDLVLREGKLTYDINLRAIEYRGLKVGTNIKSSGRVVH